MDESVEIARTQLELAKILHLSQPRISQLLKKGLPVESDGTYNVKKITNWMISRLSERVETMLPVSVMKNGNPALISQSVSELNRFREVMEKFKRDRGDIFCGIEGKLSSVLEDILDSTNSNDIQLIPLKERLRLAKDITTAIGNLYEKERLERNLSTDNVQLIVTQIMDLKRRKAAERKAEEEREKSLVVQDGNQSN